LTSLTFWDKNIGIAWLSLQDDFVTTNFGTHAPCACASPLAQNSDDATAYKPYQWLSITALTVA